VPQDEELSAVMQLGRLAGNLTAGPCETEQCVSHSDGDCKITFRMEYSGKGPGAAVAIQALQSELKTHRLKSGRLSDELAMCKREAQMEALTTQELQELNAELQRQLDAKPSLTERCGLASAGGESVSGASRKLAQTERDLQEAWIRVEAQEKLILELQCSHQASRLPPPSAGVSDEARIELEKQLVGLLGQQESERKWAQLAEDQLQQLQARNDEVETELLAAQQTTEMLQARSDECDRDLREAVKKIEKLETRLGKELYSRKQQEAERDSISHHQSHHDESLKKKLARQAEETAQLKGNAKALQAELEASESERNALRGELESVSAEVDTLAQSKALRMQQEQGEVCLPLLGVAETAEAALEEQERLMEQVTHLEVKLAASEATKHRLMGAVGDLESQLQTSRNELAAQEQATQDARDSAGAAGLPPSAASLLSAELAASVPQNTIRNIQAALMKVHIEHGGISADVADQIRDTIASTMEGVAVLGCSGSESKAETVAQLASVELEAALDKIHRMETKHVALERDLASVQSALDASKVESDQHLASIEELVTELEKKEEETMMTQIKNESALKQAYDEIKLLDKQRAILEKKRTHKEKASALEADLAAAKDTIESLKTELAESDKKLEEVVEEAASREDTLQSELTSIRHFSVSVAEAAMRSAVVVAQVMEQMESAYTEALHAKQEELDSSETEYELRAQAVKQGVDHKIGLLKAEKAEFEAHVKKLELDARQSSLAAKRWEVESEEMGELQQAFQQALAELKQKTALTTLLEAEMRQQQEDHMHQMDRAALDRSEQQAELEDKRHETTILEEQVESLEATLLENAAAKTWECRHAALSKENTSLERQVKELQSRASRVEELQAENMREVNAHEETKSLLEEARVVLVEQKESDHASEKILDEACTHLEVRLEQEKRKCKGLEAELQEALRLAEAAAKEADAFRAARAAEVNGLEEKLTTSKRALDNMQAELRLKENSMLDLLATPAKNQPSEENQVHGLIVREVSSRAVTLSWVASFQFTSYRVLYRECGGPEKAEKIYETEAVTSGAASTEDEVMDLLATHAGAMISSLEVTSFSNPMGQVKEWLESNAGITLQSHQIQAILRRVGASNEVSDHCFDLHHLSTAITAHTAAKARPTGQVATCGITLGGLQPGKRYVVKLYAGNSVCPTQLEVMTLSPPEQVRVEEVRPGGGGLIASAALSWSSVEGATSYMVERFCSHGDLAATLTSMVFDKADRHKRNGHLTVCEFGLLDRTDLEAFGAWLKQDKARYFKNYDHDKDGTIDRHECTEAMREYLGAEAGAKASRGVWRLEGCTEASARPTFQINGLSEGGSHLFRVFAGHLFAGNPGNRTHTSYETQGCLGVSLQSPKGAVTVAAPKLEGRPLEKAIDGHMAAFSKHLLEQGVAKGSVRKLGRDAWQVGTKKVTLSISSGALVVKVGGGFMNFTTWVEKHQRVLKGWSQTGKELKENIVPVANKLQQDRVVIDSPAGLIDTSAKASAA